MFRCLMNALIGVVYLAIAVKGWRELAIDDERQHFAD